MGAACLGPLNTQLRWKLQHKRQQADAAALAHVAGNV